jgi:hypothetical protein
MKRYLLLSLILCLVAVSGCGYSSGTLLPPELTSINVANFVNTIDPSKEVSDRRATYSYWPGLETMITRGVIDRFIFDRHLDVESKAKATMLLEGELVSFRLYPLSYDKGESIVEFRVQILVNMTLYNNLTGEKMWTENSFMGQSDYNISGPNALTEGEAVKAAVLDLANRVVERTVEAW